MKIEVVNTAGEPIVNLVKTDDKGNTIIVATFNEYCQFNDINSVIRSMTDPLSVSSEIDTMVKKYHADNNLSYKYSRNKAQCDFFKRPVKQFVSHLNKLMFKVFIADIHNMKIINNLCTGFNHNLRKPIVLSNKLQRYKKYKNEVDQVFSDKLENISPFVLATGKTPSELKQELGSGLWKSLCKNSLNKNKLIVNSCVSFEKDQIKVLNECASTVLAIYPYIASPRYLKYVTDNLKGSYGKRVAIRDAIVLLRDTECALQVIGKDINMGWSLRRMKEEHDKAVSQVKVSRSSTKPLAWITRLPDELKQFSFGGFTATALQSPADVVEEGNAMNHCVGSLYTNHVIQGDYLVFSIKDDKGMRYSTLGCSFDPITNHLSFDQHYKRFNAHVDRDEAQQLAFKIIQDYRKIYKPKGTTNAVTN